MTNELKERIKEENKYSDLLKSNPKYILQGCDMKTKKRIVGIIRGNPNEYHVTDFLDYKYFDSWKDAYMQLELNKVYCSNCGKSITPEVTEYEEGLENFESEKICPICEEYIN